jgi:deoxyribose-phosphate aldolase
MLPLRPLIVKSRTMNSLSLTPNQLAAYIDHTCLQADATLKDIERLCAEAREYSFCCVCVNGSWVRHACHLLEGTNIKVAAVAGFPLGAMSSKAKRFEVKTAIDDGAQEIDVVLNIGRLRQGDDSSVLSDLREVVEAASKRPVKVILETCLLTREEKIRGCRLAMESGARFAKTSTGFSSGGATVADIALMREIVGPEFGIKASGGIRDTKTALAMLEAGATRIGTSAGVTMVQGLAAVMPNPADLT